MHPNALPDNNEPNLFKPRKKSIFRRFAVGMGVFLGTILLILVLMASFFQKQVTNQLLIQINKGLKTELKVNNTELSLLRGFPEASAILSGVRLKDAFGGTLLEAQELSFHFALMSLFSDQIQVHSVLIKNGTLQIRTDRNGRSNYDITKENASASKQPKAESKVALALENAVFENMELIYDNRQTKQKTKLTVENASFAGNFSAKKYNLTSSANFTINTIELDSSRYLTGEKVQYDAVIEVDVTKDLYNLQGVEATLGGNTFAIEGIVISKPDFTDYNLKLLSKEGDISMVFNLLPGEYHDYFSDFQSSGTYSCGGSVKGRLSKSQNPSVSFDVMLRDGKVTSDKLQSPIRDVAFKASYIANPDGSGSFNITGFKGNFGGQPLNFDLKITNLEDPMVDFKCNGLIPLDAAYGLFDNPAISGGDGLVRINSLVINGKYADMTSMNRVPNVSAAGEIVFENAELTYNKIPVKFKEGKIRLEDNVFTSEKIQLQAGDSEIAFDGSARNLLPVLFADSLNSTDAYLEFAAKMVARTLDIDQIFGMLAVQETASDVGTATVDSLVKAKNVERKSKTDKLRGTFEATIEQFNFEKIIGKNFSGKLAFDHNLLLINGETEAMGGKIHVEGDHHFEQKPFLRLRCVAQNIDLTACLEQCDNFGQEVIQSNNIKGRMSGRVAVWAYWDDKGNFLLDKTKALVDVSATNGELTGVKMFEDFSTFIHVEDLRRVKFTNLQNYLEISNSKLNIPAMLIQSNAVNLTLSGTHSFDNDIDYKVKVNAGQVLFNRMKKYDNDLDPLPAEKGLFNLFYVIKGNLDKYDMKRSKKTVKADFEKSEAKKKIIATQLDEAFGNAPKMPETIVIFNEKPQPSEEFLDEIQGGAGQQQ